jgi:hypothetical protein
MGDQGYPAQPTYPTQPVYPPAQPVYPPAQPGYTTPEPGTGYAPQPGYAAQPGYAPQPGYSDPAYGAQPGYAPQPGYSDPAYGAQPGYAPQPGWGDPAYGAQPGYGAPSYGAPGYGVPVPPRKGPGRLLLWLIPLLVVVALVGAGAAVLITRAGKGSATASATSSPAPKVTTTAAGASTLFTLPDSVDGLPKSANTTLANTLSQLITTSLPSAKTVAGVYQSATDPLTAIILIGAEMPIADPAAEVRGGFTGLGNSLQLSKPKTYPAGSLGGVMQCASGKFYNPSASHIPVAACAIADNKGMIMTLFLSSTEAHAVAVTTAVRPTFEHP